MFGLNKYIDKLYDIEWSFNEKDKSDFESLLFVEFETIGKKTYKIKTVKYTYVDVLLGLEELDFEFKKNGEHFKIVINN